MERILAAHAVIVAKICRGMRPHEETLTVAMMQSLVYLPMSIDAKKKAQKDFSAPGMRFDAASLRRTATDTASPRNRHVSNLREVDLEDPPRSRTIVVRPTRMNPGIAAE